MKKLSLLELSSIKENVALMAFQKLPFNNAWKKVIIRMANELIAAENAEKEIKK